MSFTTAKPETVVDGLSPSRRRFRYYILAVSVSTLAASFVYAPWVIEGPVLCPFRMALGLPCPSCGLTRSFCSISQGRIADAFAFHPLGPVLFAGMVIALLIAAWELLRNQATRCGLGLLMNTKMAWTIAYFLIGLQIYRLASLAITGQWRHEIEHSVLGWVLHSLGA